MKSFSEVRMAPALQNSGYIVSEKAPGADFYSLTTPGFNIPLINGC